MEPDTPIVPDDPGIPDAPLEEPDSPDDEPVAPVEPDTPDEAPQRARKRAKLDVMGVLAETVREFDVVLVQEIRDSSRQLPRYS